MKQAPLEVRLLPTPIDLSTSFDYSSSPLEDSPLRLHAWNTEPANDPMMDRRGFHVVITNLDDFLSSECQRGFVTLINLLHSLGCNVSWHKSYVLSY